MRVFSELGRRVAGEAFQWSAHLSCKESGRRGQEMFQAGGRMRTKYREHERRGLLEEPVVIQLKWSNKG